MAEYTCTYDLIHVREEYQEEYAGQLMEYQRQMDEYRKERKLIVSFFIRIELLYKSFYVISVKK